MFVNKALFVYKLWLLVPRSGIWSSQDRESTGRAKLETFTVPREGLRTVLGSGGAQSVVPGPGAPLHVLKMPPRPAQPNRKAWDGPSHVCRTSLGGAYRVGAPRPESQQLFAVPAPPAPLH